MRHVAQRILSRNWGSSQLAKLRDLQFNVTVSAGVGSLFPGTNLILPGRGTPSGSATLFSRSGAFPKKILLLALRITGKLYRRIQPIIFQVRFPKWHAAGRDTHYFLKTSAVGGEVQLLQSVLGLPAHGLFSVPCNLSFFPLRGVAKDSFLPLCYSGNDICPLFYWTGSELLLRKPNRRSRSLAACPDRWSRRGSLVKQLCCNYACFSVPKNGNRGGAWRSLCHLNR